MADELLTIKLPAADIGLKNVEKCCQDGLMNFPFVKHQISVLRFLGDNFRTNLFKILLTNFFWPPSFFVVLKFVCQIAVEKRS